MKIISEEILNKWTEYTLINDSGIIVSFLNYGGIITRMKTPNRDGKFENIVLSYQNYKDYEQNPNYFGAIIGRVAGRIQYASFHLGSEKYELEANEGSHHLHGVSTGFQHVIWDVFPFHLENKAGVKLSHTSPESDSGYPGEVQVTATYTLTNNNEFLIFKFTFFSVQNGISPPLKGMKNTFLVILWNKAHFSHHK